MEILEKLNKDAIKILLRNNLLIPLIKGEIIKEKIKNIQLDKSEIDKVRSSFISKFKIETNEEYNKIIQQKGVTEIEFLNSISEPLLINKYCIEKFSHTVERRYLERKSDLDIVSYSLLRVQDRYIANELYQRIIEKEAEFGEMAAEFSLGPEKNTQGVIGPIGLTKSHPMLSKMLKGCKEGEVNRPFQVNNNWLIVRLESFQASKLDSAMELRMAQELFNESLEEEIKHVFDILTKEESNISKE